MYRRIEILLWPGEWHGPRNILPAEIRRDWDKNLSWGNPSGVLTRNSGAVSAWTEKGWERFGKSALAALEKTGECPLRVVEIRGEVLYRDEWQIILIPEEYEYRTNPYVAEILAAAELRDFETAHELCERAREEGYLIG